jgi:hypothetical protein
LVWVALGWIAHIIEAFRMKTWCGTPIWYEPSTYVMFFPASLLGPIMFVLIVIEINNDARRKIDKADRGESRCTTPRP